jgi:ABC-type transport system involved in multi-copper enzyme maturation permease subunit
MYAVLRATIDTNLVFYRRNRLLVAAAIFLVLIMGLTSVPSLVFTSTVQHLELIKTVLSMVTGFATIVTVGLGLLLVSQHIRDRSVKMVFTKPCLPEVWLLGSFLSAGLVAAALFGVGLLIASVLFAFWGIPFQTGVLFIVLNAFVQAMSLMAFATFLSVVFHPVMALFVLLVLREGLFYWLKVMLAGGIKSLGPGLLTSLLKIVKLAADALYMLWPTFDPYGERMSRMSQSLRGSDLDGTALLLAVTYSILLTAAFYFLTAYVLKKKRYA